MSLRLYRLLLLLYPAEFRSKFEREMMAIFADQLEEARSESGSFGCLGVWSCAFGEAWTLALPMQLCRAVVVASAVSLIGTSAVYVALLWALTNTSHPHRPVHHALLVHLR